MHKAAVVWGDGSTCVFVRIKLWIQGKQGKEGGSRTETKDLSCSSKVPYLHVRYSTCIYPVFSTEMVISSSQTCYKYFPSGTYLPARPDPWLLHFFGVIFAFLSLSSIWGVLITLLVKRICGRAGSDHLEELHLDTCWEMNWQWLQVRFVCGWFSFW